MERRLFSGDGQDEDRQTPFGDGELAATTLISRDADRIEASNLEGAGTHLARARQSNLRAPSPFLQSMVQAADRIARGPVLDLASSLPVEEDLGSGEPRSPVGHGQAASQQTHYNSQNDRTEPTDMTIGAELLYHDTDDTVTVQNSPSLPPLTRQSHSQALGEGSTHRDLGSSTLTELLRRFHETRPINTNTMERDSEPNGDQHPTPSRTRDTLSERSSEARRSLERALRDYRMARRALRSHNPDTDERTSRSPFLTYNTVVESSSQELSYGAVQRPRESIYRHTERTNESSSAEASNTSSVPTVAALRAARLSMQRSLADHPGSQSGLASSNELSSGIPAEENGGRQAQRITIIRDVPRRFDWRRDDIRDRTHSSQQVLDMTESTDASVRPNDLNADSRRRLDASLLRNRFRQLKTEDTASRKKAKKTLRYLTHLKAAAENDLCPVSLATELGLDSLKESLEKGVVFDLPSRLDELPRPKPSSWLESSVSWSGEQACSAAKLPSPYLPTLTSEIPIWAQTAGSRRDETDRTLSLRARRHRERVRAERFEREQQLQDAGPVSGQSWSSFGLPLTGSIEILADMERHLSDLLEEERASQSNDGWTMPDSLLGRQRARLTNTNTMVEDRWPVSVKLHAINFDDMTVHGTMSASHIPNRNKSNLGAETDKQEEKGAEPIESFFDGEIIDFCRNELETVPEKQGYKCGGLGIDLQYWAALGPFREEVERQKNVIRYEKQVKLDCGDQQSESSKAVLEVIKTGTKDTYESVVKSLRDCAMMDESALDNEENDRAVDEAMIRCLGSKKWMDDKLGREWVLMRWKERSFVTPASSTSSGPSVSGSTTRSRAIGSTFFSTNETSSWGLTISGFYYIALHRQTGKIEGLYYDPGSQPFQRLEMWPVDTQPKNQLKTTPLTTTRSSASGSSTALDLTSLNIQNWSSAYDDDLIGIRKWFPATDFR